MRSRALLRALRQSGRDQAHPLERDPHPSGSNNIKPLKGKFTGAYRYRVGDLRVVYSIDDRVATVFVITIAKRSDVYE